MSNVFCFIPAFGQMITAGTFLTSHALMMTLANKGIAGGISTLSFPDIAELRAMATTIWYDTMPQSSHLLFVDADMAFPPDLVLDMLLLNEPLVGTIYPQRRLPISWAGSGTGEVSTERRGGFMKVEGVGMGATLIRRDCITKMIEAYPELIDSRIALHPAKQMLMDAGAKRLLRLYEKMDIPERGVVSEDLSFCIRWNKTGGVVWGAIGHKISHIGPFDFSGRYLDAVEAQQRAQAEEAAASTIVAQPAEIVVPAQATPSTDDIQTVIALPATNGLDTNQRV